LIVEIRRLLLLEGLIPRIKFAGTNCSSSEETWDAIANYSSEETWDAIAKCSSSEETCDADCWPKK